MYNHICLNCNKEYKSYKENSKFCSNECKSKYNNINYKCDYCGKEIIIRRNKYDKLLSGERKGIYCSKECADKAHTFKVTKICECCGNEYKVYKAFENIQKFCSRNCFNLYKQLNSKSHEVICEYCGKSFTTNRDNQRYCSKECSGKSQRNRIKCICENCGKEFERIKSEVDKNKHHYCSTDCKMLATKWSEYDLNILRTYYNKIDTRELQKMLSKEWSITAIKAKSQLLGLGKDQKWTSEEDELFKNVYSNLPINDVLKLFPNRTIYSLIHRGQILGVTSKFYTDRKYTDDEINYYINNYLTMSDEELSIGYGNKHSAFGIHQKLYALGYTRPYEIQKDGYRNLASFVRSRLHIWKKEVMEYNNYTCYLTGKRRDLVIHHCRGFNLLFDETIDVLNFKIKENFIEYTDDELLLFLEKFIEIQDYYHAYVCISEEVHKLFHKEFGYGDNTVEQWDEFVSNYKNGKYNIAA